MADIVDQQTRSRMMARIRSKDTRAELVLRNALYARGFRYRLHAKNIPGRPDIVLRRYRAIIFVHGCFWHRHKACRYTTIPLSRHEFWAKKFGENLARDTRHRIALMEQGWRVAIVWECALRKPDQIAITAELVSSWLRSDHDEIEIGESDLPKPAVRQVSA